MRDALSEAHFFIMDHWRILEEQLMRERQQGLVLSISLVVDSHRSCSDAHLLVSGV